MRRTALASEAFLLSLSFLVLFAACGGDVSRNKIIGKWKDTSADKTLEFFEDGRAVATVSVASMHRRYAFVEHRFVGGRNESDEAPGFADLGSLSDEELEHASVSLAREYAEYAFVDGHRIRIKKTRAGMALVLSVVSLTDDKLELKGGGTSVAEGLWAGQYKRTF